MTAQAASITSIIICLALTGCASERVATQSVAVPVSKVVYRPLDPALFQGCPEQPLLLSAGITNADLLSNRDQWQLLARCYQQELQTIHDLK